MHVVMMGTGALGGLFAHHLALAGAEVLGVDNAPEHLAAMQTHGLHVRTAQGEIRSPIPAFAATPPDRVADVLVCFVKGFGTVAAMAAAQPAVGPNTLLVTLQNGLGNAQAIAEAFPGNPVLYGLTTLTSDLVAPGVIEPLSTTAGTTDLWGDTDAARRQGAAFVEVLQRGGIDARLAPDITLSIWKKLAVNCALNPLCALTGLRCGELVDLPAMVPAIDTLVDEVAHVAQALGVPLPADTARAFVHQVAQASRRHYPSMAIDVRHGRRTEIETLCGAVLREADRLGLPAPGLRQAYALVSALDARLAS